MDRIVKNPIDARATISKVESDAAGAVLTFAGTVRRQHRGREVVAIDYHAYETMAAREIEKLEEEIRSRWPEVLVAIVHRIGFLKLGEASVLIAVSSPHRDAGFESLRYAIDELKKRAPIWKKEVYRDGDAVWLEGS